MRHTLLNTAWYGNDWVTLSLAVPLLVLSAASACCCLLLMGHMQPLSRKGTSSRPALALK